MATLLPGLFEYMVQQLDAGDDANDNPLQPASSGQIPSQQCPRKHAGVCQGVRLPQGATDGARKRLPGMVKSRLRVPSWGFHLAFSGTGILLFGGRVSCQGRSIVKSESLAGIVG